MVRQAQMNRTGRSVCHRPAEGRGCAAIPSRQGGCAVPSVVWSIPCHATSYLYLTAFVGLRTGRGRGRGRAAIRSGRGGGAVPSVVWSIPCHATSYLYLTAVVGRRTGGGR